MRGFYAWDNDGGAGGGTTGGLDVVPQPLLQEVRNLQVELAVQDLVTPVEMAK